jgi:hypothetical protein
MGQRKRMNFRDELRVFYDRFGLMSPYAPAAAGQPAPESGNNVLYTGEEIALLYRLGMLRMRDDYCRFNNLMVRCMPVRLGLLHRSPVHPDQQAPDDYVGYLVGCILTNNTELPRATLWYALTHLGFMNNVKPGSFKHPDGRINWESTVFRQPHVLLLLLWACGFPSFLYLPLVLVGVVRILIASRGKPEADDRWILPWLFIQAAKKKSWLCRLAAPVWERRVMEAYPDLGMKSPVNDYFGGRTPPHPFTKYWPKV